MKTLSLKLKDEIFKDVEKVIHERHIARNSYINEALSFYNTLYKRKLLKSQLMEESKLVEKDSLKILKEFEKFEDDLAI